MMADKKMFFFHFFFKAIFRTSKMAIRQTTNCFPETFQGLLSRYLGILPNFFQGMFRDFCPIIWAFCVFFPGHISGTSVPLSGHSAVFFSGNLSGTSVPLSRHSAVFFSGNISGTSVPLSGHSAGFFFREHFRDFCPVIWAFCRFFFSRLAKTAEQLSNFWKLLKIENWFKFSILQKVLCCSFHFVPIRFKNWFWFPRNVPGTSVSFSDRILPNMAPKKKIFQEMFRRFCFLPWENAWFSLENAWFSLEHAWFSLEHAWFSWENAWFSWENAWFSCENAWSSWENPWFSQHV